MAASCALTNLVNVLKFPRRVHVNSIIFRALSGTRSICTNKDGDVNLNAPNLTNIPNLKSMGDNIQSQTTDVTGLSKAVDMFERINQNDRSNTEIGKKESFATLMRNSKIVELGDPEGRIVIGEIFEIINDDLYIDFGCKFHCVCPRPKGPRAGDYKCGSKVRLRLIDLELSSRFMGATRDITLLEADAVLLGLHRESATKVT